jgi:hypothetical protein
MAWRNLTDFLATDGPLKGLIPITAECHLALGNGVKLLKKKVRKLLRAVNPEADEHMTLKDFQTNFSVLATDTDWTFTPKGRFIHFRGPYKSKSKPVWYEVVRLDMKDWLMKQSHDLIAQIATEAFGWRPDSEEQIAKFYKRLEMSPPALVEALVEAK